MKYQKNTFTIYLILFVLVSQSAFCLEYNADEDLTKIEKILPHPNDYYIVGLEWVSAGRIPTGTIISPNCIITAAHWKRAQSTDANWPVGRQLKRHGKNVLEDKYIITEAAFNEPNDLLICRVKRLYPDNPNPAPSTYDSLMDPKFKRYMDIYEGQDEKGEMVIIGGYGAGKQGDKYLHGVGKLHWGRNRVSRVTDKQLYYTMDAPGKKGHVQYEALGINGDSGSPWFIYEDGWKMVCQYRRPTSGPRLSTLRKWCYDQIARLERTRIVAERVDH